eukprot:g12662.t1
MINQKVWIHIGISMISKSKIVKGEGAKWANYVNRVEAFDFVAGTSIGCNSEGLTMISKMGSKMGNSYNYERDYSKVQNEASRAHTKLIQRVDEVQASYTNVRPQDNLKLIEVSAEDKVSTKLCARHANIIYTQACKFAESETWGEGHAYSAEYIMLELSHFKRLFDLAGSHGCSQFHFLYNGDINWVVELAKVEAPRLTVKPVSIR